MKSYNYLLPFDHYILRTPLFPIKAYKSKSFNKKVFNEALYLASPNFYAEVKKNKISTNHEKKIFLSLYKYLTRASIRCTPFGLFAGCSYGIKGIENKITLSSMEHYKRCTRLDMDYMCSLINYIETLPEIIWQIRWFSNGTIYSLGDKYRYIEYFYLNGHRKHRLSCVEKSEELDKILLLAGNGCTGQGLVNCLINENISENEAKNFLLAIIDAQLLKSELEVSVTGENPLEKLLKKIDNLKDVSVLKSKLTSVYQILSQIDSNSLGTTEGKYNEIISLLKDFPVSSNLHFLFQTDLFKPLKRSWLSEDVYKKVYKGIDFLNRICTLPEENKLTRFRKMFYDRYENQAVPLLIALDSELGIDYLQIGFSGDDNELIDDLPISSSSFSKDILTNSLELNLYKEIIKTIDQNEHILELSKLDFFNKKSNWENIPDTISVICSVLKEKNNKIKVFLKSVGGGNGAYLIGRFGHLDWQIKDYLHSIAVKEEEINPNAIIAEIVHLPEARVGNIIFRPAMRKYEIPYLTQAGVNKEFQLPLSDLMIKIVDNRIVLFSNSLKKEILPKLTNAHNYTLNSMPIYHFLCDLQFQGKRFSLNLNLDRFLSHLSYIPRIEYENCILCRQKWKINYEELKFACNYKEIALWRERRHIPKLVMVSENDNELLIDFDEKEAIEILRQLINKYKNLIIEEFLFYEGTSIVKSCEGEFCNEFVLSYYKNIIDGN